MPVNYEGTACEAAAEEVRFRNCSEVTTTAEIKVTRVQHRHLCYTGVAEVPYPRLAPGHSLNVLGPSGEAAEKGVASEMLLVTRGAMTLLADPAAAVQHCAHFHFGRVCQRGARCEAVHMIHVVSGDEPAPRHPPKLFAAPPKKSPKSRPVAQETTSPSVESTSSVSPGATLRPPIQFGMMPLMPPVMGMPPAMMAPAGLPQSTFQPVYLTPHQLSPHAFATQLPRFPQVQYLQPPFGTAPSFFAHPPLPMFPGSVALASGPPGMLVPGPLRFL